MKVNRLASGVVIAEESRSPREQSCSTPFGRVKEIKQRSLIKFRIHCLPPLILYNNTLEK